MSKLRKCKCGGKPKYDCDGCGHEWLTCDKRCGVEVEVFEGDINKAWNAEVLNGN